jgi:sporulation protein YlmC with PRC-barrel domain
MKNLMLGTAIAVVFGASASAQDLFRSQMDPVAITASDFIGKRVYAAETAVDAAEYAGVQDGWNDIGEINDVILTRDGKVDAVLVDIGGFLGMGERQVAVGMENIRFVSDSATAEDINDYFLVINADRATLKGAPDYMSSSAMPADTADAAENDVAKTNIPAVDEATGAADTETATNEATTDGTMMVEGQTEVDLASVTSDKLIGTRVYGPKGNDVGEISEIMLDANGAPGKVIVDVGGFLGIGEKPVALDITSLTFMEATDGGALRAYSPMTQEELEGLPATEM